MVAVRYRGAGEQELRSCSQIPKSPAKNLLLEMMVLLVERPGRAVHWPKSWLWRWLKPLLDWQYWELAKQYLNRGSLLHQFWHIWRTRCPRKWPWYKLAGKCYSGTKISFGIKFWSWAPQNWKIWYSNQETCHQDHDLLLRRLQLLYEIRCALDQNDNHLSKTVRSFTPLWLELNHLQ